MKSLRQWKNKVYAEATLPIIDIENKKVGNELASQDVESGGKILGSPFKKKIKTFKSKITELPTPEAKKEGLGELGLKKVSDTTFGKDRLEPGRTPVISQGVPVKEEVFEEVNLPRPILTMVDRVLNMLGNNPMRAMALQQYIRDKLQGVLGDAGNSWARRGAMATKNAGMNAMQNVGQPQPAMAGAMEAVGTPRRLQGNMPDGFSEIDPTRPEKDYTHSGEGQGYERGNFRTNYERGDFSQNDMANRWLRNKPDSDDVLPQDMPPEASPIPGPLDDPKIDAGWGREMADDLRQGEGGSNRKKRRGRVMRNMMTLSDTQLDRVENLLKMMKVGADERQSV